jgi:subtilisin family serine protease
MKRLLIFVFLLHLSIGQSATIAIIDTGFDLDHDYLKPNILNKETDEEAIDFHGWDFFDNSHMKSPVINDASSVQEILLYRNLKAKGHRQGLSLHEFEWFKRRSADKSFMENVRLFKKHVHGTFVAGIALREGENINIFPIRGLNIPNSVVAVEDSTTEKEMPLKGKNAEEKFQEEIKNSLNRVTRKFSKICNFVAQKKIQVVNASYGITYKGILTKFRERYLEMTGKEINEKKLKLLSDDYFRILYERGEKAMRKHSNILFVFSAGNSALDNDTFHHYPSRIKVPNAISVGAMNGEFLATFSNYGQKHVDIGAPGVAIMSILPKIYSQDGVNFHSPSSGTSMAAPYVSNLAAQIINANPRLKPADVKKIILQTGEVKEHLRTRLSSAAVANNRRAIKAALLSLDMELDQAITLGSSDLIPMEDKISMGLGPAKEPEETQNKMMNTLPSVIPPQDIDEETLLEAPTKSESSSKKGPKKVRPDSSALLPSVATVNQEKAADPALASQNEEQSQKPSEDLPASSSEPQSGPSETQSPLPAP